MPGMLKTGLVFPVPANEHFTFGYFESAIVHFHLNLHAALADLA